MSKQQSLVQIGGISMTKQFESMLTTKSIIKQKKTVKIPNRKTRFENFVKTQTVLQQKAEQQKREIIMEDQIGSLIAHTQNGLFGIVSMVSRN